MNQLYAIYCNAGYTKLITGVLIVLGFIAVLIASAIAIGDIRYNNRVKNEVWELFKRSNETKPDFVTEDDLKDLPETVQRWLRHAQIIGKEEMQSVRLKQKGFIRTKEDQKWMPFNAEQYFMADELGFIWNARIKMAPLIFTAGRDKYRKGKGNMVIKLLSLITVVNASGKEIDQGTLLRYLGETVWFPSAALSTYITWEDIDSNSARAIMSYGGITASAVFNFNDKGEVINFGCERYMAVNDQYILGPYSVHLTDYKECKGIRIPTKVEAVWNLKAGVFSYFGGEIIDIEYNNPSIY